MSTTHPLIDTHIHLYDDQYAPDLDQVIARSREAGVEKVYMPNLNETTLPAMCAVEERYPSFCRSMLGLHPCDVDADYEAKLNRLEKGIDQHAFVGIGEIGLDFYHSTTYQKEQFAALERQLEWARFYGLPAILHARNSLDEVIATVKKSTISKGIVHCFTGTSTQAQQVIDLGFHIGIGGIVTFPKSGLPQVIREVAISSLVLETDGPYLAPQAYRGKRNEPSYLPSIAAAIADHKEISLEKVCLATTQAAKEIFGD